MDSRRVSQQKKRSTDFVWILRLLSQQIRRGRVRHLDSWCGTISFCMAGGNEWNDDTASTSYNINLSQWEQNEIIKKDKKGINNSFLLSRKGHNSLLFMCWKITSDLAICAFTEGPSYGEAWASSTSLPLGRGLHSVSAQVYIIYKLSRVLTKIRYTVYVRIIKWTSCMNSLTIYMHYSILWSFDILCVCSM